MKNFYVYVHLNPKTNEIFYIGKGTGKRAKESIKRNSNWKKYVSQLTDPYKVLIVQDNLSESKALELEQKIIDKLENHMNDVATNIAGTKRASAFATISLESTIDNDNEELFRFTGKSDDYIRQALLSFPNSEIGETIRKSFEDVTSFFHDNWDELEELDDDNFLEIEDLISDIEQLVEDLETSENEGLDEFKTNLKREVIAIDMLLENDLPNLQAKFLDELKKWTIELTNN
jgi:hypothetical protein